MNELAVSPQELSLEHLRPDHHPVAVYLSRLSPGSRRAMRSALERLAYMGSGGRDTAMTYNWHTLRYMHVALARRQLIDQRLAPTTINKMLSALRGVVKECFNLRLMSADEYQRIINVPQVRGSREPAGRSLTAEELGRLFAACGANSNREQGERDAALLSVAYCCGLRRSEIVSLNVEDLQDDGSLRVLGKGNKERTVWLANGALAAVRRWAKHQQYGPLFTALDRNRRRLSADGVHDALKRLAKRAGVEDFSPHDLRRTTAGDLLDAGEDIVTVQKILGHSSPEITARYDRRGERVKARAATKLHVPFEAKETHDVAPPLP